MRLPRNGVRAALLPAHALLVLALVGSASSGARAQTLMVDAGVSMPVPTSDAGVPIEVEPVLALRPGVVDAAIAVAARALPPVDDIEYGATAVVHPTGTRTGRASGASHLVVLRAEDIRRTPSTTLDEALNRLPVVSLQGINKNMNDGGNGLAMVDLRNLGSARTLVLLNGRRLVQSGYGRGEAVDTSIIPIALIERVEILLDGAAAIYGSEAVGGVINVVLRRDFEGLRSDVVTGSSGKGDAEELGGSLTWGVKHGKGNLTVHAYGLVRRPVWQRNRSWSRRPVAFIERDDAGAVVTGYGSDGVPEGRSGDIFFRPDPATGRSFSPFDQTDPSQAYNFARENYLVGSQERIGFNVLGDWALTRHARTFVEASHIFRHSRQRFEAAYFPFATEAAPDGFVVPASNAPADFALDFPADSYQLLRNNRELGPRRSDYDANTTRVVLGLEGEVPAARLDWEAYVNYGIERTQQTTRNSLNLARALETADPALCATLAQQGCTAGNYFGAGSLQPAVADYIRFTATEALGHSHLSVGLSARSRPLTIMGQKVALAAGFLLRRESGFARPGAVQTSGESSLGTEATVSGSFLASEGFLEAHLPLLANLPGVHDLSVRGAGRVTHHDTFGTRGIYLLAFTYAPASVLRFRASYSTSYRAPGISELFGSKVRSYERIADPCSSGPDVDPAVRDSCAQAGIPSSYSQDNATGEQIATDLSGNRALKPERGKLLNLGVTVSPLPLPRWAGRLSLTLDYYRLHVSDAIVSPSGQTLVSNCYEGGTQSACGAVSRNADGAILGIDIPYRNADRIETSGIDAMARYRVPLAATTLRQPLMLEISWLANRLLYFDEFSYSGKASSAGYVGSNFGALPLWRWSVVAGLAYGHWSLFSTNRYLGGSKDAYAFDSGVPGAKLPSVVYWDLAASYYEDRLSVLLGINNLLDRRPPFMVDGVTNSSAASYDYVGRYLYARLRYQI